MRHQQPVCRGVCGRPGHLWHMMRTGAERIGELYYRIHLNDHVELTPSLQYIARPAANLDGQGITCWVLRARVGF